MKLRELSKDEFPMMWKNDLYCFSSKEEDFKRFIKFRKRDTRAWAVLDGENVVSTLLVPEMEVRVNGRSLLMAGISSVTTLPEYRNRGLVKEMMEKALRESKKSGKVVSYLFPFLASFYRKFGYGMVFEKKQVHLPISALSNFSMENFKVREADADDWADFQSVYEDFTESYHGFVIRTEAIWRERFEWLKKEDDFHFCYLFYDEEDVVQAYCLVRSKADRKTPLKVSEMAYRSISAREAVFAFLYRFRAQERFCEFYLPLDDPLFAELEDPYEADVKILPAMMARILDAEACLEELHSNIGLTLKVRDPILECNNNEFDISGGGEEVEIDIASLSQAFIGALSGAQLLNLERAKAQSNSVAEIFARLFPKKPTFMNEDF